MKLKSCLLALAGTMALASLAAAETREPAKLAIPIVSEELTFTPQRIDVLQSSMSYIETGSGDPVLFVHGNPTSSYLWRNVMPHVADTHRAIAVDLIGMEASGKPDFDYTFADHARFLDVFIAEMGLTDITLVGHDWGAALVWDFTRRSASLIGCFLSKPDGTPLRSG